MVDCVKPQLLLRDDYGIIIDESTRTINIFNSFNMAMTQSFNNEFFACDVVI